MKLKVFMTDAAGAVRHLGAIEADLFERAGRNTAELGPAGRVQLLELLGKDLQRRR
jgi:hypothetical protein